MPTPSSFWKQPPAVMLVLAVPVIALVAVLATRAVAGPTDTGAVNATANTIVVKNFKFVPATLSVKSGAVLKVQNTDGVVHTFTARNHSFDTGNIRAGATVTVTPTKPGTIEFFCKIHNFMTGKLEVTR